jgi:hypothetical protein
MCRASSYAHERSDCYSARVACAWLREQQGFDRYANNGHVALAALKRSNHGELLHQIHPADAVRDVEKNRRLLSEERSEFSPEGRMVNQIDEAVDSRRFLIA